MYTCTSNDKETKLALLASAIKISGQGGAVGLNSYWRLTSSTDSIEKTQLLVIVINIKVTWNVT